MGGGESGTGAALLAKVKGYDVFVSDQGPIKEKYKAELNQNNISFEEGQHTDEKILNGTLAIKSPGIPDKAEIIKKIKAAGISIIDEIEFAFLHTTAKVIAITGTNGKTTTTLLTYHLMKNAGFNVGLAGNVGFSMARQVAQQKLDWYVLEMSSFQLDGTKSFKPEIAILLNITPDHLDRYDYNMQNYIDSKFSIIKNMGDTQNFIFYADDDIIAKELSKRNRTLKQLGISLKSTSSAPLFFDGEKMNFAMKDKFNIKQSETTLNGPHNLINTMAAVSAVSIAGSARHPTACGSLRR